MKGQLELILVKSPAVSDYKNEKVNTGSSAYEIEESEKGPYEHPPKKTCFFFFLCHLLEFGNV